MSSTPLDVILHNSNLVKEITLIDCPFSDHKFVLCGINIERPIETAIPDIFGQSYSSKNLEKLSKANAYLDFSPVFRSLDPEEKLNRFNDLMNK